MDQIMNSETIETLKQEEKIAKRDSDAEPAEKSFDYWMWDCRSRSGAVSQACGHSGRDLRSPRDARWVLSYPGEQRRGGAARTRARFRRHGRRVRCDHIG